MAQSPSFPYTPVPNSLKRLLEKIPTIGTPSKADGKWLAGLGFSGGNNAMNLTVMRHVGIIGSDGTPTDLYKALRTKDRATFATGLRKHYAELFSTYPDANRKDDEALITFVRSKTDYGDQVQKLAVRTFKTLSEFGDFDKAGASADTAATETTPTESPAKPERKDERGSSTERERKATASGVGLTVNIQLQLPPSADGEVYDKLFAAMAKHLKGLVTIE